MKFNYDFHPVFVNRICYITHKMKKQNFHGSPHKHDSNFYEIIFLDYGKATLILENKLITMSPGECVFVPGKIRHSFWGKAGIPFSFMNIMFHGKIPSSLLKCNMTVYKDGYDLMKRLKEESVQKNLHSNELMACYLTEFIIKMVRQKNLKIPNNLPETAIHHFYQSEIVNRAISVISNEYSKKIDLKKLSLALGVSKSHLRTLLKKETGETFGSILRKQRIATAKHLLSESTLSLEEIAGALGYSSLSFFFKVFKRSTGMTPKTYAASLGETEE